MKTPTLHSLQSGASLQTAVRHAARNLGLPLREHETADGLLASADTSDSGCVVTPLQMPGRAGYGIQRQLLDAQSPLTLIYVASIASVSQAVLAMRNGAATVLESPFSPQQLTLEIENALAISARRRGHIRRLKDARERLARLTPRERETLPGVLSGKTNDAVAHELAVSTRTIERRRRSILERLGVECFAEVVRLLDLAEQSLYPFLECGGEGPSVSVATRTPANGELVSETRQSLSSRPEPQPVPNWQAGAVVPLMPAHGEAMTAALTQDSGRMF